MAPLDSFAATDPVGSVYAEFHTLGKASKKPRNAVVLIGMWTILGMFLFMPVAYMIKLLFSLGNGGTDGKSFAEDGAGILILGAFAAVPSILLWRTTINYFRKRAVIAEDVEVEEQNGDEENLIEDEEGHEATEGGDDPNVADEKRAE